MPTIEEENMLRTADLVKQLTTNQLAQQRYCQSLNAEIVRKDEQISLLVKMGENHEARIQRLEQMLPKGKKYDA